MTADFEPHVEEVRLDDVTEPRIRWGKGYSVIALGDRGRPYDLPGRPYMLGQDESLRQRDVLVFGERSSGVRDFLDWWRRVLDIKGHPWIFLHGAQLQWMRQLSAASDMAKSLQERAESSDSVGPLDAIEALGKAVTDNEKAEQLIRWAGNLESPFHLIIRDFSDLGKAPAESFARAFRIIRDQQICPNLHLLIGSVSETAFKDSALWSGYLALSRSYRVPSLGAPEIEALVRWYEEGRKVELTISVDAINELLDVTGGQPLLVQEILKEIVEKAPSGPAVLERKVVRDSFLRMKRSPPDIVTSWQDDLRKILGAHRELVPAMSAYVSGRTLSALQLPPPSYERPLMVSGWVKMNRFGRWGISSQLHAALGRPILDEISRG